MFADRRMIDPREPTMTAAVIIAIGGAATLLGAWFFQYAVGLWPCPLCLEQRVVYYFAIPLATMVMLGVSYGATPKVLTLALFAIAVGMLWNAGLGVYHSGIEWKLWVGPPECSGTGTFGSIQDLQNRLRNTSILRCDEAQWRFLGLSLAGYNALISFGLAVVAMWGALAKRPNSQGSSSVSQ
ncbi:MAG TPA: disulfide bond formation protein B [Xanthobacteraceae bacterium]|nr:disulfide bond formation protein B [Xanthobacteraceae bacterium]